MADGWADGWEMGDGPQRSARSSSPRIAPVGGHRVPTASTRPYPSSDHAPTPVPVPRISRSLMIAQPAIGRVGIHASVLARRAFGHRPELVTLSSTSPSALFLHLKHRLADHKSPNVIVYALPTSLPSTTIPFFLDLVRSSASSSVGLLSSPLPPSANAPELRHSIAIATLDSKNCRVFRSERKGRPKVSVGRWRPFGEADSSLVDGHQQVATAAGDGDWSKVWNPLHEETDSIGSDGPAHLSSIAGLEGVE